MSGTSSSFEIVRTGDVDVVRLTEPKLGQPAIEALQSEIARRIADGARKMVINLAPVAFVDSFSIGVIAAAARAMQAAGGSLKVCGAGERVRMSLTITRLDRKLDLHDDEGAALRSFGA